MGARTQLSPAEYLLTSFDFEPEYIHGEVRDRTNPTAEHGRAQGNLFVCFEEHRRTHLLFPAISVRMRLADDLYRISDVAVFAGERPESIPNDPPLVAAE